MTDLREVRLELAGAITDMQPPAGVERLHIGLQLNGREIDTIALPVFGGVVPAAVIADAAAAKVCWDVLGHFLEHTVYPRELTTRADGDGASAWRRGKCLVQGLDPSTHPVSGGSWLHDTVGWTVFLQELWGRPDWGGGEFYDPDRKEPATATRTVEGTTATVEISDPLEGLRARSDHVWVDCRVGGTSIGWVWVPNTTGRVTPQQLRAALTTAGGLELCVAAVREGVIGRPLDQPGTLRERLAHAAGGAAGGVRARGHPVLGRHPHAPIGSGASRRAVLPAASLSSIRTLTGATTQPLIGNGDAAAAAAIHYSPELLAPPPSRNPDHDAAHDPPHWGGFDRHYFESLFAAGADPWKYRSDYEVFKYKQTLDLVPAGTRRALELACAEGDFTVALATRAAEVVAADISELALTRAAERCAHLGNVTYCRLDMASDPLPGGFDVIVCSEVLYFVGKERLPQVSRALAGALAPGGRLILAHANLQVDAPDEPGFDWNFPYGALHIGRTLAAEPSLRFVRELRSPHYRIQVFAREARPGRSVGALNAETVERIESVEPIPTVAATFHRGEDRDRSVVHVPVAINTLPILMYHRVAPEGVGDASGIRVSPEQFEQQLAYLAASGFRSVTAEQWRRCATLRRPLPGRGVLLTFDGGYRDFALHAWPLLQRYGFGAHVFLVSDHIGGCNEWDTATAERIPLLDWDDIDRLSGQGVVFGSQSATHRRLPSLSPSEVAEECLRSRATLQARLGDTVSTLTYPWGEVDAVVEHLAGAAGYVLAFSSAPGSAQFSSPLMALPRTEITGDDSLESFIRKLGSTRI